MWQRHRVHLGWIPFVLAALGVSAALVGCSTPAGRSVAPASEATPVERAGHSEIRAAAKLLGRDDVRPVEIKGSWAWLGGEDITAYRDELTGDEYIVDEAAGRVLSYVSAAELPNARPEPPAYEGEPSREEVFTALDTWLAGQAEGFDLGTMRPVSTRRVDGHEARGDTLEYTIRYQRYVEGVAVNEWVTGIASVPSWTWKPTYRVWKHRAKGDVPVVPTISFGEALRIASGKTPPSDIASAELKSWGRGLEWMVITKSGDAGMTTALNIDATTGEVLSKAVSSSAGFVSTAD